MHEVATTPTATDALLERKAILESNKELIALRDTLQQDVDRLQPVLQAIKEEIRTSGALPDITRLQDASLAGALASKRREAQQVLDGTEHRIIERKAEEHAVNGRILAKKAIAAGHVATIAVLEASKDHHECSARSAHKEHTVLMEHHQGKLASVLQQVSVAETSLATVQDEEKGLRAHRASEDVRLANKGRDLDIYEARIREAAGKLTPPMQIHV